jgi:hypothetical protein
MATAGGALKSTIMSMAPSPRITAERSASSRCSFSRVTGSANEINRMRLARAIVNAIMPGSACTTHLVGPRVQ